jgi:hypothetical protein
MSLCSSRRWLHHPPLPPLVVCVRARASAFVHVCVCVCVCVCVICLTRRKPLCFSAVPLCVTAKAEERGMGRRLFRLYTLPVHLVPAEKNQSHVCRGTPAIVDKPAF